MSCPAPTVYVSPNNRAGCKACGAKIEQGSLRISSWKASAFHDGYDQEHYHALCRSGVRGLDARSVLGLPWALQFPYIQDDAQKAWLRANAEAQRTNEAFHAMVAKLQACRPVDVKALVEANGYAITNGTYTVPSDQLVCVAADGLAFGALPKCDVCKCTALRRAGGGAYAATWCGGFYGTTPCEFTDSDQVVRGELWTVPNELRAGAPKKAMRAIGEAVDASAGRAAPEGDARPAKKAKKVVSVAVLPAGASLRAVPATSELRFPDDLALQEALANVGGGRVGVFVHEGSTAWNVTLNSVNVSRGENKFYKLQLLTVGSTFAVFARWGRVGDDDGERAYSSRAGSKENKCLLHPHESMAAAMTEFEKIFKKHAGNDWAAYATARQYTPLPGSYDLFLHPDAELQTDSVEEPFAPQRSESVLTAQELQAELVRRGVICDARASHADLLKLVESTAAAKPCEAAVLPPSVRSFVDLIFSERMLLHELARRDVNLDRFPLGELSATTIRAAYAALSRAAAEIERFSAEEGDAKAALRHSMELLAATNDFLKAIPHQLSKVDQSVLRLSTPQIIQEKVDLVSTLEQVLQRMRMESKHLAPRAPAAQPADETPADETHRQYAALKCDLQPVAAGSAEFEAVRAYLSRGGVPAAGLQALFKCGRAGEAQRFAKHEKDAQRRLLWHGSSLSNWAGIFSQGLRIAPPEAPASGYNFDKGLYFADASEKSFTYCRAEAGGSAVLLLADVACGDCCYKTFPDTAAKSSCELLQKDSVFARGMRAPDEAAGSLDLGGATLPLGALVESKKHGDQLLMMGHNEFIVYDEARVQFKYVLLLQQ